MAVRLTNFIREQILDAVLKHAFAEREKALEAEKHALGDAVYNDTYPEPLRKQMAALPEGFLPTDSDLRVQFEGHRFTHVYFGERRRVAKCHDYSAARVYDEKHPLTLRYEAWKKAQDELGAEKSKAKSSAEAVLGSVTTVNKLIQVWPEVEQFARPFAKESPSRAIALPIKELNQSLGLPPKSASAAQQGARET